MAVKFGVCLATISNYIKKIGLKNRKRVRAPKKAWKQEVTQKETLARLCDKPFALDDPRDILLDGEFYVQFSGESMRCNQGYCSNDKDKAPDSVKLKPEDKFPNKIMIWTFICKKGMGPLVNLSTTRTWLQNL